MPVIATTAIVYGILATNAYDRYKFQEGSQPYQPTRVVSCPLNEYGRPQGCRVDTAGRFANPYAVKNQQSQIEYTESQNDPFDSKE